MNIQIHGREETCGVPAWAPNEAHYGKNVLGGGIVGLRLRPCKAIELLPCVFLKAHSVACGEAKLRPLHFMGTVLSESFRKISHPGLAIA